MHEIEYIYPVEYIPPALVPSPAPMVLPALAKACYGRQILGRRRVDPPGPADSIKGSVPLHRGRSDTQASVPNVPGGLGGLRAHPIGRRTGGARGGQTAGSCGGHAVGGRDA